jgi:superfamily II DNA or RNA helicase
MNLSETELETIRRINLPARWGALHNTRISEIAWLVEAPREAECRCSALHSHQGRARELICREENGIETALSFGTPSKTAREKDRLLRAKDASLSGEVLTLSTAAEWRRHPEQIDVTAPAFRNKREAVLTSWQTGISYRSDANGGIGLRTPQLGALHAIAAHWSISQQSAIIVMPTGTGKTEVMLATTVSTPCSTVLVVVPSDALRTQTAKKFQTLGVLRAIGVVPPGFLYPVVGTLRGIPRDDSDLELFDVCNVVVATMNALSGAPTAVLDKIAARCTHLFIDEAHHTPAETWNNLRERFSERAVVQFTATPFRRDGRRMDGRLIYNYPLAKAQAEGYFRPIQFEEVWEWEPDAADQAIAAAAIDRLRADLANNLDHMLMARADSIDRAKILFETLYKQHSDLNPVVIHNRTPGRRQVVADIKQRRHRVIVCVDMLGEGFDLPQLKIAALHDAHRSLGVTLQFAGRFTRTEVGIGDATVVANLADRKISESLEELYSENADWNLLLPGLSHDAVRPQLKLSEFITDLQSSVPAGESEILSAATITPKTSTIIYEADRFRPDKFRTAIPRDAEVLCWWKNMVQKVLVFILRRREDLGWARTKDVTHRIFDLYVLFYDSAKKLLFLHSSVKGGHLALAKAVGGPVVQLRGEKMFRSLGGIERITFYNAGLLRGKSGALRFQMFSGLDVAKAIDPVEQQGATKSNLFGAGYESGKRVTIGCSQKGTVWSLQTSSIPEWREWCQHVGAKILNSGIRTDEYLDHTMVPEQITALPTEKPLCVEWPAALFEKISQQFEFTQAGRVASWLDCDLDLQAWTAANFEFAVRFADGTASTLRAELDADRALHVSEISDSPTFVRSSGDKQTVVEFFEENPSLLRFPSGAELTGSILVKPRTLATHHFALDALIVHDWSGVDLTCESQWKNGVHRPQAVQRFVIDQLLADPAFTVVADDDDAGEAADVLAIRPTTERIEVHFYHCKYAGAFKAGSRAGDLYVVCGQAEKGVVWTLDFKRLVEHLIHRENQNKNGRPSRFERGSLKEVSRIQRLMRKIPVEYHIKVVQPGVSKASFEPEHSSILGATSLFLRQRLGTALQAWVSA